MSSTAVLRPLILASTSPYRTALLNRFGLPFEARNPSVDESEIPGSRHGPGPPSCQRQG
jgi:predicted house-cleaning NTP pyrophosphatase (Maf/HAM1 superfamily)